MPSAFRAPRTLSNWFELDYYRRRTLFRGWWGGLLIVTAAVSLLGLGVMWQVKGNTVFQAGPLSPPHAMFNHDCKLCHQDHGATLARMAYLIIGLAAIWQLMPGFQSFTVGEVDAEGHIHHHS